MACNVVIQGIEFQNLAVTDSIMLVVGSEPGIEIAAGGKIEDVEKGMEVPRESSMEVQSKKNRGIVGALIYQLADWLNRRMGTTGDATDNNADGAQTKGNFENVEESELWIEWEWILSEAEKFVCRRSAEEANEIQEELSTLRKNANLLKSRPTFLNAAKLTLERIPLTAEERELLAAVPLDSNKRSKIVSDVVAFYGQEWRTFVEELFIPAEEKASVNSYREAFEESLYQKGVIGGLKEAGWQASHGPGNVGLTVHVLGDITWTFWKMLVASVRYTLEREPKAEDMHMLAERVCECQEYLVELWFGTVKNSEFGAAREGELPKRWAKEAEENRRKLEEIKKAGVTAKYEYKPVVVLASERKELTELKKFLETSLHFHVEPDVGKTRRIKAELK